jgi:hypothetical protein
LSHLSRVLLLVVLALLLTSCASPGARDRITEYDTSAVVHADGTLDVTETITYDFGTDPSPGLLREIPLSQRVGLMRHRTWEIDEVEVTSPSGAPADIEKQDEWRRVLILEIGDTDAPVTGAQTYEISYTVHGALNDEGYGPQLHWDFVGDEWGVPIQEVSARVEAPSVVEAECFYEESYRDGDGNTEYWDEECDQSGHDGSTASFGHPQLSSGTPLSGVVYLEEGTVEFAEPEHALAPLPRWITLVGVLSLIAALLAAAVLLKYVGEWQRNRRLRIRQGFTEDLPDLPPAVAGFLFHGKRLRAEHALALIVSLEEKGHLTSVPKEDGDGGDWLFVERHSDVPLTPAERALRRGMFGLNSETDLVWLGRFLTKSRVKRIERSLLGEAGRYGLVIKLWLWYPIVGVFMAALVAALCTGLIINEFTSLNLTDLELVSAAVLPVVLVSLFKPAQRTPYGDHVHDLLTSRRRNPQGLEPVMGIALGLPDETVRTLNAKVPNLSPYLRDHRYRRRWNRTVDHRNRAGPAPVGSTRHPRREAPVHDLQPVELINPGPGRR